MANDQNNTTGQNGATGDWGSGMARMAMRGMSMQNGMNDDSRQNGESVRERLEYRAKMKKYKEKHDKAVETFKSITGETIETREGAVKALAWIMKNKSYTQAAEAIMAASDFCWACNEEDAEKDVKEEVSTLSGLMRGFGGNINIGRGGNALGVVGTVLGAVALGVPLLRGGLFGGPGNGGPGCDFVTQRELSLVRENGNLAAENGQLKAQIYTDNKTDSVIKTLVEWRQRQELIDTQVAAEVATLKQENANMKAQLGSMLGTYITPNVMLPSQAVATQIASKTTTAATGS